VAQEATQRDAICPNHSNQPLVNSAVTIIGYHSQETDERPHPSACGTSAEKSFFHPKQFLSGCAARCLDGQSMDGGGDEARQPGGIGAGRQVALVDRALKTSADGRYTGGAAQV
jgi:hypothetical protein